jgi:hypothetical protein
MPLAICWLRHLQELPVVLPQPEFLLAQGLYWQAPPPKTNNRMMLITDLAGNKLD